MTDLPPPPGSGNEPGRPPTGPPPAPPGPPPPPADLDPPPGYQAYQNAPTPMGGTVSRIGGVAKAATILTGLTIPATALSAIVTLSVTGAAKDLLNGEISSTEFEDDYAPLALLQILAGLLTLAAAILSVIWLYRVASNLRTYNRDTTWAPIWAVFSWILPPLLYVIPLLMLREQWKASDPSVPIGDQRWKGGSEQPLLWVWFALYSLAPLALAVVQVNSVFGGGFGSDVEDLAEQIDDFGTIGVVSGLITIAAAVVWILVVRAISDRHTALTGER